MKEIWKDIENYEGLYQVSNFGCVRSLERIETLSNGVKRSRKSQIRKPIKDKDGYLICSLCKNSKYKIFKVHRLVAQAFIPNPNNLPQINHKDENKSNNCVDNLEWCTCQYNTNYGTAIQRRAEKRLNSSKFSKPVLQLDKESGQVIAEYPSTMEAERQLNIYNGSISKCCNGKYKTTGGFKWLYK